MSLKDTKLSALVTKQGIKIVILGIIISALFFLTVRLLVYWTFVDYKPENQGAESLVEVKAYVDHLPVEDVIRQEMNKVDHDPVLPITSLFTGFWLAYAVCTCTNKARIQKRKEER